jgi:predicted MPP superfamily phosphohydrolase
MGNSCLYERRTIEIIAKPNGQQNDQIEITHITLNLPQLEPAFSGYRLVQFSDIHMDTWMTHTQLAQIVKLVNQQKPNLVAITGDFVGSNPARHAESLVENLRQLESSDGVVAVLGNHDHWKDPQTVRKILQASGISELANRVHTIERQQTKLYIAGIDDYMSKVARFDTVLEQLPREGTAILLAHAPDFADISGPSGRFALQLSGHSHGGQINLPLIGPPYLPRFARKYVSGLNKVGEMLVYTNRGVGKVHLPFRLNSRPEITVFQFNGYEESLPSGYLHQKTTDHKD